MKLKAFERIIEALNNNDIKYLIAGGLAVVAHGYVRFTADIDLILDLSETNVKEAMRIFKELGFIPRAPVNIESFADKKLREQWIQEKNLKVFSLWNKQYPLTEIDLFVSSPVIFEKAYEQAVYFELKPGLKASFLSFDDLIETKKLAGRPKDIDDIKNLLVVHGSKKEDHNV